MGKKIGIVGFVTLGSYLFNRIQEATNVQVVFVQEMDKKKVASLDTSLVIGSIEQGEARRPDLVVEVASAGWVNAFAATVLKFSDLLIFSVAALAEQSLQEKLDAIAKSHRTCYYVSHGAIVGLDGVRDGREMIEDIRITTIRPPGGYGLDNPVTDRTVLYDGPTRRACQLFPHNVNIHASLALHGLGFDRTHSIVIADPEANAMRHILEVKGRGLAWKIEVESKPLGERTGAYVPESAFQTVKRICSEGYGMKLI
jgi:aspartate dehydrogenase